MEPPVIDYWSEYLNWLRSQTTSELIGNWTQIEIPFLDRHNDHLQLYVRKEANKIYMTDDGYILSDLAASGCDISSPRRKDLLHSLVNGFGVRLSDRGDAIVAEATTSNMAQKMHSLLQAMLSVNDMFMTSRSQVFQLFLEEVIHYFDMNEVRYTPSVQFVGRSGMTFKADFVIPKSRKNPERIVNAINNPTKESAKLLLFGWQDVRATRSSDSSMYAILNDTVKPISEDISNALEEYQVKVVPWSCKDQYIRDFAA